MGRYAAPDLSTASSATIRSADRGSATATSSSGPAPAATSRRARRLARASSSANVRVRPANVTAGASGLRRTTDSKRSTRVASAGTGAPGPRLLHSVRIRSASASPRNGSVPIGVAADVATPPQDPGEPVGEGPHRGGVEKIGGVGEFDRHPARRAAVRDLLGDGDLKVELRDRRVEFDAGDAQIRQLESGLRQVLEREHHLEQRVPGLRAGRVEHLDEAFERHVCVRECLEVGAPHPGEQVGERLTGHDGGAQHQGVDEHADHVVQSSLAAARDGGCRRRCRRCRTGGPAARPARCAPP